MTAPAIRIPAPASKSVSHRALICAALTPGETSLIVGPLASQDLSRTRDCLTSLGAVCRDQGDGALSVQGMVSQAAPNAVLDVGESGTTCRLMTAVAAALPGERLVRGEGRMHQRPIRDLVLPLQAQGVHVTYLEKIDCPPLRMQTRGLAGGRIQVSLEQSSQYLSGLLLAAPLAETDVCIEITGSKAVSWPYVALTVEAMQYFGTMVRVEIREKNAWIPAEIKDMRTVIPGKTRFIVSSSPYTARKYEVEGDWSNASYFLAAGCVGTRPVLVTNLRADSLQGDRAFMDIVSTMGGKVQAQPRGIAGLPTDLQGADLDMGHCPDLVPTVATMACFASGETRITNVAHLRLKESDRLAAVAQELSKTGAEIRILDDGLVVRPGFSPGRGDISLGTHNDHRMAMSLSLLEFAGFIPKLDNPDCVAKSFPEFWKQWDKVRP
jgi:3-phosphoshikimate 1-carboxyvinyltransferase